MAKIGGAKKAKQSTKVKPSQADGHSIEFRLGFVSGLRVATATLRAKGLKKAADVIDHMHGEEAWATVVYAQSVITQSGWGLQTDEDISGPSPGTSTRPAS